MKSIENHWFGRVPTVSEAEIRTFRRVGLYTRRGAAIIWTISVLLVATGWGLMGEVVWREGFEEGAPGWTIENGVWEIGAPDFEGGPASAFSGANVAGTVLDGNYPSQADALLVSPEFAVPAAGEFPKLRYWYWYDMGFNSHFGRLQIRPSGSAWQDLPERPSDRSGEGGWMQHIQDLRPFAGQTVQIGFRLRTTGSTLRAGWYIDEVSLETGPMVFEGVQDFEESLGDWSAENGLWQWGAPTAENGPASAYSGTKVVGTILSGDYPNGADSRLVSPEFMVPPAFENPRFRYFYWYETAFPSHFGQLQIRASGGAWQDVQGERVHSEGGGWAQRIVDLRPFAGQPVQIAFRLVTTSSTTRAGWYVDQVSLETGPLEFNEAPGFAEGYGDWSVEGGAWQIGPPTAANGPDPLSGQNVAGTILAGNYPNQVESRLVSPEFTVPAVSENPRFRFWQWYDTAFNTHFGQVEIRTSGGAWQEIPDERVNFQNLGWSQRKLDLRPYAGQPVQIAFRFRSTTSTTRPGWYIDDAALETGPMVLPNPDGFEHGFGDWSSEGGVWQVGAPTAEDGPEPRAGQAVAGTVLDGNYPNQVTSRLVSPEFLVPVLAANPRLVFWHWYDTAFSTHNGRVQISSDGGANWTDISQVFSQNGRDWTRQEIDLSSRAGQRVKIAFRFVSTTSTTRAGWYIDDFAIESDTVDPIENAEIPELESFSRLVNARGNNLQFDLFENAPEGAAIDSVTGQFSWMPSESQGPGVYADIQVGVTQPGNWLTPIDSQRFTIAVNEINHSPVLSVPLDQILDELTPLNVSASATDSDLPPNPLTFSLDSPPDGMTIDANTGEISWIPAEEQGPGSYEITVVVTDFNADAVNEQRLSDTKTFNITVREVNHAPILTLPSDQVINELTPWSEAAIAVDSDLPANPLTFSLVDPPAGMTINPQTGVMLWTPSEEQGPGSYEITVVVTDFNADAVNEQQLSDSKTFNITVREVNHAPVLTVPDDQVIDPMVPWTVTVSAADVDVPANPLTFSLVDPPAGMGIDAESGEISWSPSEDQAGAVHTVTVRVTDNSPDAANEVQLSDTGSFQVEVRDLNVAPVFEEVEDPTVHFSATLTFQVSATDANPDDVLTYSLDEAPQGMTIDSSTGILTWAPGQANVGSHMVTVRVTDDGVPPLSDTMTFEVIVTGEGARLAINPLPGGLMRVQILGDIGVRYELEATSDFIMWESLLLFNLTTLPFNHVDAGSLDVPIRFYRLVVRPE